MAGVAALVYALVGARLLLWSLPSVVISMRQLSAAGSGGVGAVFVGLDLLFVPYILLALASIVANRMVASWARRSGSGVKTLHTAQTWTIVLAFLVVLATPVVAVTQLGPVSLVLPSLTGVVWGAEFVLTAALVGAYALSAANV